MKIDLYTKAVLTVIAACLLVICIRDVGLVGEAHAQMKASRRRDEIVKATLNHDPPAPQHWEKRSSHFQRVA